MRKDALRLLREQTALPPEEKCSSISFLPTLPTNFHSYRSPLLILESGMLAPQGTLIVEHLSTISFAHLLLPRATPLRSRTFLFLSQLPYKVFLLCQLLFLIIIALLLLALLLLHHSFRHKEQQPQQQFTHAQQQLQNHPSRSHYP